MNWSKCLYFSFHFLRQFFLLREILPLLCQSIVKLLSICFCTYYHYSFFYDRPYQCLYPEKGGCAKLFSEYCDPKSLFGLEFCSVVALFYRTEWNFFQKKNNVTWINIFTSCYYYIFFIPESSLLLFSALAIFYFISFTYYMTHSNKSITVVPEFKNNKKATFDD